MRTYEAIDQSFRGLLLRTPYQKISIKDVCESANVARTIFYAHYVDKDDLLKKVVHRDLIDPIWHLNKLLPTQNIKSARQLLIERVLQGVLDNKEFYSHINAQCNHGILEQIIAKGFSEMNASILEDFSISQLEKKYLAYVTASALAALISEWIRSDYDLEPQQLARFYRESIMGYWDSIAPIKIN